MDLERVVVVGASLAGVNAAATLRESGWDGELIVLEAGRDLPPDRPPLSKQFLLGSASVDDVLRPVTARLDGLDVDLRLACPVEGFGADDRRIKLFNDHEIVADGVVIATGSSPRFPPGFVSMAGVHVVRTLDDAQALKAELDAEPSRVVVIGAGFIGAEIAATARRMGLDVTMVEMAPLPLARVLHGMVGEFVADLHRQEGVEVRLGVGLQEIVARPDGSHADDGRQVVGSVILTDGTEIDADVVVLGLGVTPNVGWLEGSGVALDNGVVCDETLAAAEGIVAAGDVANWPHPLFGERMRVEHWDNAIAQGAAAARRLLRFEDDSEPTPFADIPWFWSDQYDCKIQMAGRPGPLDDVVLLDGDPANRKFAVAFRRGDNCVGVLSVNRPRPVVLARMKMAESLAWSHVIENS